MAFYETKYFGQIDIDNLEEYYESEIIINENPVEITADFSVMKSIDKAELNIIEDYIDNFKDHETSIRTVILNDFKQNGFAKEYISLSLEYHKELSELIEVHRTDISLEEQLLSIIQLVRVVFYLDKDDNVFAVYDYSISEEITNDLLVVIINKDGSQRLTIES